MSSLGSYLISHSGSLPTVNSRCCAGANVSVCPVFVLLVFLMRIRGSMLVVPPVFVRFRENRGERTVGNQFVLFSSSKSFRSALALRAARFIHRTISGRAYRYAF